MKRLFYFLILFISYNIVQSQSSVQQESNNQSNLPKELTESDIQYTLVRKGNGRNPGYGDKVIVHFTGKSSNDTMIIGIKDLKEYYSMYKNFTYPCADFYDDLNKLKKLRDEYICILNVGSKAIFNIPDDFKLINAGNKAIFPGSNDSFEIELLEILPPIKPGYKISADGYYYNYYTKSDTGIKPQSNDTVTVIVSYKTLDDSLLLPPEGPIRLRLIDMPGGKVIMLMSKGDSAGFIFDSNMFGYKSLFSDSIPVFNMCVRLLDIETGALEKKEREEFLQKREIEEREIISNYIREKNITLVPSKSGLYFIELAEGKGKKVEKGDRVIANYKLFRLDGSLIESNSFGFLSDGAYIIPGVQEIEGVQEAILKMKVGGKAKLILPSSIAFGEKGSHFSWNYRRTGFEIFPYTPLIIELELVAGLKVKNNTIQSYSTPIKNDLAQDVKTSINGIRYAFIKKGVGSSPEQGDKVVIRFANKASNDTIIIGVDKTIKDHVYENNSYDCTSLDQDIDRLIKIRDECICILNVGSKATFNIASIYPGSRLVFEMELLEILPPFKPGYKIAPGYYYKYFTKRDTGDKPQYNDIVTLMLSYKTMDDSVLYSSHEIKNTNNGSIQMEIGDCHYVAPWCAALMSMSKGDSASFIFDSDILGYKDIHMVNMSVKLLDIKSEAQEKSDREELEQRNKIEEPKIIAQYIREQAINVAPTKSGLYFIEITRGHGKKITEKDSVVLNYTLSLLNGTSIKSDSIGMLVSDVNLIQGMREALEKMEVGGKAKLIVPSSLAFRGFGLDYPYWGYYPKQVFVIPSYTPVVIELEVLEAKNKFK